ncbi:MULTISPECIES: aspartate/glutamate racemase family protein [Burkholderiaceae]|uniref:aspartate/glutamate racemase family protein n=1 Tax=Burkholderiaceae TaxID=119060 RepID=UPI00141F4742|nr:MULTISPECIES: aspartate/glutamate racemase family protein [Burkholderiaceae]MBN3846610.1 aspartate/glutamate racemase family protein [Paraburkholderia sp. Ac-20342]NIF55695.1 aspartate/glutamate racemase family protein [Burkholderia sp. Ax-1724]NIF78018.1 aspartate/glutamate racemase family protein [Paraburkholderia sp. Cy-641]
MSSDRHAVSSASTAERFYHGGKSVYGAPLGILMLDARFPRIPGDMGNATTWPFPVLYKVVKGASPDLVVLREASGTLERFIDAARELVDLGAEGITTNCGFLALFQRELQQAVPVPVLTSSLLQVAQVGRTLAPGKRVGIVTISSATLTQRHLSAAGVPPDTPIAGTDEGAEFSRVILGNELTLDRDLAERDVVTAAITLTRNHPDVGAIVLECTNMCPYANAVRCATGLPVFDIYSLVSWFQLGLAPRRF